jgi:hypothetical protein
MIETWCDAHEKLVESWLVHRGLDLPAHWKGFPPTGAVVNRCYAGFVYLTNSEVAYLDSFVSDKASDADLRNKSLLSLVEYLEFVAAQHGKNQMVVAPHAPTFLKAFSELNYEALRGTPYLRKAV